MPQTWSQLIFLMAGILIGLIPEFYRTYRDRKKSDLENAATAAKVEQAQAEVRSIQIRDDLAASEQVGKMLGTLIETGDKLREQQAQIFELQQDKIELIMRREEVRRMKALLVLNDIPYSDADKFRMK